KRSAKPNRHLSPVFAAGYRSVGGAFPHAARRAIRYGDGWVPIANRAPYGEVNEYLPKFKQLLAAAGRDPATVPITDSVRYYESVAHKLGGVGRAQSFYRLFMAPGMQHCGGEDGPNAVGGPFGLPAPARDPEHDVVAALAHWVEDGVAPERIVATKYRDND